MPRDSSAHSSKSRRDSNEFISVREAAIRLGVFPSKIYRMPREGDGPFRIFNHDRHVLVERTDFERYLVQQAGPPVASDALSVPTTPRVSPSEDESGSRSAPAPSITSSGQRPLILPPRRPFVVIYMA